MRQIFAGIWSALVGSFEAGVAKGPFSVDGCIVERRLQFLNEQMFAH